MVIDRMTVGEEHRERIMRSLAETMRQGKGTMILYDYQSEGSRYYSRHLMCPTTGDAFEDPAPHTFSFNSPKGACPQCNGLGEEAVFDIDKIMPDATRSLRDGGIEPLGKYRNNILFAMLDALGRRYGFTLDDAVGTISKEGIGAILYGDSEPLTVNASEYGSSAGNQLLSWEGVSEWIERDADEDSEARTEVARAVHRLSQVFALPRHALEERGSAIQDRRQEYRRRIGHVDSRVFRMDVACRGAYDRQGA